MCRNIKKLRVPDRQPSEQELHDAALQFIRKISGYNKPSKANQRAFDRAVRGVAGVGRKFFDKLEVSGTGNHRRTD